MSSGYHTVFDLTGSPDRIQPAYWFYAIFIVAGVVLILLTLAAWKWRWRRRWSLSGFAAFWTALVPYLLLDDARGVTAARKAVELGAFQTVEGCLDYFRPGSPDGSKSMAGNEEWSVAGKVFSYGQGEVRPGYHLVSRRGGAVSADSRVRVSFVTSPKDGRPQIVRLAVAKHACPTARSGKPFRQP
jgi:hypothetical protein